MAQAGVLYVVATPIGNMGDISARAREILAAVSVVAAEDTRHSSRFLRGLGLERPLLSLHEQNERARATELVERLRAGESVALISDAGTPLISDPGYQLLRAALAAGIVVSPIPGACAAIAALTASGLPSDRFCFEGFLPARAAARRRRLAELAADPRTLVIYEAPHRIATSLADIAAVCGGTRRACIARELTKRFETFYRGSLMNWWPARKATRICAAASPSSSSRVQRASRLAQAGSMKYSQCCCVSCRHPRRRRPPRS